MSFAHAGLPDMTADSPKLPEIPSKSLGRSFRQLVPSGSQARLKHGSALGGAWSGGGVGSGVRPRFLHRSSTWTGTLPRINETGREHCLETLAESDVDQSDLVYAMRQDVHHHELKRLLELGGDVHVRDSKGRTLVHLWSWNLPKSRNGIGEAKKKLDLLVRFHADLDARLPKTGETPLHILARVFNTLSARAEAEGGTRAAAAEVRHPEVFKDSKDAEKFIRGVCYRIQLLVHFGANPCELNQAGRTPLELVAQRFRAALPPLMREVHEGEGVCEARIKTRAFR